MSKLPYIAAGFFALLLPVVAFVAVVALCALFQGGVMSYMGFEYEGAASFFLFFTMGYLICTPFDFLVDAVPGVLAKLGLLKPDGFGFYGVRTAGDAFFTAACLGLVDMFMDSVDASWQALIVSSAALAAINSWIDFRMASVVGGSEALGSD